MVGALGTDRWPVIVSYHFCPQDAVKVTAMTVTTTLAVLLIICFDVNAI